MLPVLNSHPRGWTNPVVFRASAALTAAGAWDAAPTVSFCDGAQNISFGFTYTRGAAGGAFEFQIEVSLYSLAGNAPAGASEWITQSLYEAGAVAPGVDATSEVQREQQTYTSQGAAAEDFVFGPLALNGTIERIRVRTRETGVIGTPGTLQVTGEIY
jgi:hypothetical protein